MRDFLLSQPPAFLAGIVLGACVVAMYLVLNNRLGVVGGFSALVERTLDWRGSFLVGVVGGGALFALLTGGGRVRDGYGWLTRDFSAPTAVVLLFVAGGLIGYGAKTAGGCTSGNGLCGNATASRASLVATMTFFATAVGVSLLTAWIFGAGV